MKKNETQNRMGTMQEGRLLLSMGVPLMLSMLVAALYNIVDTFFVSRMNLVGSLLISALVIFPALAAMRVFRSFFAVTVCSAVFSVVCAVAGILILILAGTPVGSTIVAADIIGFAVFALAGAVQGRVAK